MRVIVQAPTATLFPAVSPFQTWARALRKVMRGRMFSVQRLYQHQQTMTAGKLGVLNGEAKLVDAYCKIGL